MYKCLLAGKAPGIGVCGEMQTHGGEIVVNGYGGYADWPAGRMSSRGLEVGTIIPLYNGKGEKEVCGN